MKISKRSIFCAFLAAGLCWAGMASADDHFYTTTDPTWKSECGSCHCRKHDRDQNSTHFSLLFSGSAREPTVVIWHSTDSGSHSARLFRPARPSTAALSVLFTRGSSCRVDPGSSINARRPACRRPHSECRRPHSPAHAPRWLSARSACRFRACAVRSACTSRRPTCLGTR